MPIEKGKWGSVHETLRKIALSVVDPENKDALVSSCHSVTARSIRENGDEIPDDARIVFLGYEGKSQLVAHSIIVSKDDEIISDSMSRAEGASGAFRTATGIYSHPEYNHLPLFQSYEVVADTTMGDFREQYLKPMAMDFPPPGG